MFVVGRFSDVISGRVLPVSRWELPDMLTWILLMYLTLRKPATGSSLPPLQPEKLCHAWLVPRPVYSVVCRVHRGLENFTGKPRGNRWQTEHQSEVVTFFRRWPYDPVLLANSPSLFLPIEYGVLWVCLLQTVFIANNVNSYWYDSLSHIDWTD